MADKRFPSDLTPKTTPVNEDTILISDSEGLGSEPIHGSKYTTIENLVNMVGVNLDISDKADKDNVLELTQLDAYVPTENYHPVTKLYSDNADAVVVAYVDSELASHVVDFHALSATHVTEIIALSAAIDINTANIVTLSADVATNTTGVADNATDVVALSAAIDLKAGVAARTYSETISGAVTADIDSYNHLTITASGNVYFEQPTGDTTIGSHGMLIVQQDGTGGHTIDFDNTYWIFPAGAPVENTTANAYNYFKYTVVSQYNILTEFVADWVENSP